MSRALRTLSERDGVVNPGQEGMSVIANLLLGVAADIVFESAASMARSFHSEMTQYLEERGLMPEPSTPQVPADEQVG